MTETYSHKARIAAAAIASLEIIALSLQTGLGTARDGSALLAIAGMFRFFTIWTNFAVAILLGLVALGRNVSDRVLLSLETAIAIVAIVYHLLLAQLMHETGAGWWTNQVFHSAAPVLTIGWWLAFSRGRMAEWRDVWWVMAAPIVYTATILAIAQHTHFYPYFFLDVAQFGWARVGFNIIGLGIGFLLMGAALLGIGRAITRKRG
ncbi:Pr6Pr family membrane protein [Tsuneonella mangrovi]|uniref:Pr6Pr family membrane protein n=1 Tax=Tsuneonella mangrovi TaxID=1982042 RepID=UPI000BA27560|nr:Pr6Pr family membrane protein [Tsuneonella mangrovi]